ncbi:MAG: AAA family ATPase, partial [Succinivibrio sp.]|nr:AAA family ATPase [Succinivibrio sp.]
RYQLCLREFFGAHKDKKQIKFLAITGVTRLKDVSIFSVGSDIVDMSYEHLCSQLIGFTRDEIKKFYQDYLRLGAAYAQHKEPEQVSADDIELLLDDMARHYDGYCFDSKYRLKVFSTWSVNSFLQHIITDEEVAFENYWYDAGGLPSILVNYLKSHGMEVLNSYLQLLDPKQESELSVDVDEFKNPTSLVTINENVLMCQTGYLTLHSPLNDDDDVLLGFANLETANSLSKRLKKLIFPGQQRSNHARHVRRTLEEGSAEEIAELLKETLAAIPYDHFPLKNEMLLRLVVQFFIQIYCDNVRAEQHNHNGRSDVTACFEHRILVLELKYSQDGTNQDKLLEEAVNQIREHDYGRENLDGRELIRLALVYGAAPGRRGVMAYQSA